MAEFLREKLADLEHQQWSHWTRYFLDNINPTNKCKWVFQLETPYSELSEKEKESDRKWADKVIKLIKKEDVDLAEFLSNRLEYSPELIGDLKIKFKKLEDYQWKEPPWKCTYNINEFWEYVKFAVSDKTDKFVIVT